MAVFIVVMVFMFATACQSSFAFDTGQCFEDEAVVSCVVGGDIVTKPPARFAYEMPADSARVIALP